MTALPKLVSLQSVRLIRGLSEFLGIQKGDILEQLKFETRAGGRESPDAPNTIQAFVVKLQVQSAGIYQIAATCLNPCF